MLCSSCVSSYLCVHSSYWFINAREFPISCAKNNNQADDFMFIPKCQHGMLVRIPVYGRTCGAFHITSVFSFRGTNFKCRPLCRCPRSAIRTVHCEVENIRRASSITPFVSYFPKKWLRNSQLKQTSSLNNSLFTLLLATHFTEFPSRPLRSIWTVLLLSTYDSCYVTCIIANYLAFEYIRMAWSNTQKRKLQVLLPRCKSVRQPGGIACQIWMLILRHYVPVYGIAQFFIRI